MKPYQILPYATSKKRKNRSTFSSGQTDKLLHRRTDNNRSEGETP